MKNANGCDQLAQIVNELLEGQESAQELWNQLNHEQKDGSLSDEHQALKCSLMEKMMLQFNKTIELAQKFLLECKTDHPLSKSIPSTHFQMESPRSLVLGRPMSENSNSDPRPSKRRKTMPRWTKTVKVPQGKIGVGLEGPLDDGFSWRKYGQKDILRAKFPRGYYRCTHRPSRGCQATKQVQQSDEDQTIYQVMYRGEHTCYSGTHLAKAQKNPPSAQPNPQAQSTLTPHEEHQITQSVHQEVFVGLGPDGDLKVEVEESPTKAQLFRCYSFTTALPEPENFLSCSTDFASSPISESGYFPASPCHFTGPHVALNVQTSDYDTYDSISGPNSVSNSPTLVDFEFPLDQLVELDPNLF